MTTSTPLSPAAQAIIDAIGISPGSSLYAWIAAAALRAAAIYCKRDAVVLMTIADELELP